MAESNITIVGLSAVRGVSQITLQWGVNDPNLLGLPYLGYLSAEIQRSKLAEPEYIWETIGTGFTALVDAINTQGIQYYYRARAINRNGQFGDYTDPVAAASIAIDDGPWASIFPGIGSLTGLITSSSWQYRHRSFLGATCVFRLQFTIIDNGTGAGALVINAPADRPGNYVAAAYGHRSSDNGLLSVVVGEPFTGFMYVRTASGNYPVSGPNERITLAGMYERALP